MSPLHAGRLASPFFRPALRPSFFFSSSAPPRPRGPLSLLRARFPHASARDLPPLAAAFLLLHEATAVVPLLLGFFALQGLGAGEALVGWAAGAATATATATATPAAIAQGPRGEQDGARGASAAQRWVRGAVAEGEARAARIGRRYGWFGYEKQGDGATPGAADAVEPVAGGTPKNGEPALGGATPASLGGNIANLVGSYLLVKALLPIRIGVSLYFTPSLARCFVSRFQWLRKLGERGVKHNP